MTPKALTLLDYLSAGEAVMKVEVRGTKVDAVRLTNQKTGRIEDRHVIRYALEAGERQITCAEWLPAGSSPPPSLPWKKGDRAILLLNALSNSKGAISAGGTLHPDPS